MGGIFVNYRNGSHAHRAREIRERLAAFFGAETVFIDYRSIRLGQPYPAELNKRLLDAEVVLAVIDPEWFAERDGVRLIDREGDWVRRELELALESGKTIIPVLLDDTPELRQDELPESIRKIAHLQALRVRAGHPRADVDALIGRLEALVAPTWLPGRPRPRRQTRGPGPWPLWLPVALVLLAGPAVLVRDDAPALPDESPPLLPIALGSVALVLCGLVIFWAVHVPFGKLINSWERDAHRAPVSRYNRLMLPVLVAFVLLIFLVAFYAETARFGWLIVVTGMLIALLYSAVVMFRGEHEDKDLDTNWPHEIPTPLRPPAVRRAVARLEERLAAWRRPLSREQRDKAGWMLGEIDRAVVTLRKEAGRTRRAWVAADYRWGLVAFALWASATVGLMVASVVPELRAGTMSPLRSVLLPVGFVLVCAALALLAIEFWYRRNRRWRVRVAGEVEQGCAELGRRLADLTRPPSWDGGVPPE